MGEVERLKRLLANTTPGEWHAKATTLRAQFPTPIVYIHDDEGKEIIGWSGFDTAQAKGATSQRRRAANAKFTAAAHNDLPALLSQLEEMRERERKAGVLLREHIDAYEELEMAHVAHTLGSGPDEAVRNQQAITDAKRRMLNAVMASKRALLSQTGEVKSDG